MALPTASRGGPPPEAQTRAWCPLGVTVGRGQGLLEQRPLPRLEEQTSSRLPGSDPQGGLAGLQDRELRPRPHFFRSEQQREVFSGVPDPWGQGLGTKPPVASAPRRGVTTGP